jgi:ppGpp synthetase/RelA/SpoT-type nucleotidyltranferase
MQKKLTSKAEKWEKQYQDIRPQYREYCKKLKDLISELLKRNSILFHVIECRAKTENSFSEKIHRQGKIYSNPLEEITDFCGIRIIVYYNDDIDKICELINEEFIIDEKRSVDKRKILKDDQFGYLSVHKIISLKANRAKLSEWSSFKDFCAEIQIRTVLQHAWASISHTLQYKRESEIPQELHRKLIRLSGLLELADEEFFEVKNKQELIEKKIDENLENKDYNIPINVFSIKIYLQITEIDGRIWDITNTPKQIFKPITDLEDVAPDEMDDYNKLTIACKISGIKTIKELDDTLRMSIPKVKSFFVKFSRKFNPRKDNWYASQIHLITLILIALNKKKRSASNIRKEIGWHIKYVEDALIIGEIFRHN